MADNDHFVVFPPVNKDALDRLAIAREAARQRRSRLQGNHVVRPGACRLVAQTNRIIVPRAERSPAGIYAIPDITLGVGETHDMSQYIATGDTIESSQIIGLDTNIATYDSGTMLLTGVAGGTMTNLVMEVVSVEATVGFKQVLWSTDASAGAPFNFDAIVNGTFSSGFGYSTGTTVTDSQTIAEYPSPLVHTNHYEGGQMSMGGGITTKANSLWPALIAADTMFIRFLIKYGTADGAAEWAGIWDNGAQSGGHEYKWPDIGWETDGNRVIIMHQPFGNTSTGRVQVRIDGSGGQIEFTAATGLVSNTLYYIEIEINGSSDTIRSWVAEYDGTDTEYVVGSPTTTNTGHGWAPDFGTAPAGRRFNFGFINHNCVPAQDRYIHYAINDSFIGPGSVTSTY